MMSNFIFKFSFIQWGVSQVNSYKQRYDSNIYHNRLKASVSKINEFLGEVLNDKNILGQYRGVVGKYLPADVKREEITLIDKIKDIYIFKCEYYTSFHLINQDLKYDRNNSSYYYNHMFSEELKVIYLKLD